MLLRAARDASDGDEAPLPVYPAQQQYGHQGDQYIDQCDGGGRIEVEKTVDLVIDQGWQYIVFTSQNGRNTEVTKRLCQHDQGTRGNSRKHKRQGDSANDPGAPGTHQMSALLYVRITCG